MRSTHTIIINQFPVFISFWFPFCFLNDCFYWLRKCSRCFPSFLLKIDKAPAVHKYGTYKEDTYLGESSKGG